MHIEYPTVTVTPAVRSILNSIASRDPDGGENEPTDAAYTAHQHWAVAAYGKSMWDLYSNANWADTREDI